MKKTNILGLTALLLTVGMAGCAPKEEFVYGADDRSHWKENEETGKIDSSTRAPHEFVDYQGDSKHNVTTSTCSERGQRFERCKDCGYIRTIELDFADHNYVEDTTKAVAATCGQPGSKVEVCSVCKDENTTVIEKTGAHVFGEASVIQEAVASRNSKTSKKTCTVCGQNGIDFFVDAMSYVSVSEGATNKDTTGQTLKFASNNQYATYKFTVDKKYEGCKVALFGYIDNWKTGTNNNEKGFYVSGSATFSLKVNGNDVEITNQKSFEEMGMQQGSGTNGSFTLCYLGGTADLVQGENTIVYTRLGSYNLNISEIHFIQ